VQGDFGQDANSAGVAKVGVKEGAEKQGSDGDDAADAAAVGAGAGTKLGAGEGKGSGGGEGGKELAVALCAPAGIQGGGRGVQHEQTQGATGTTRTGTQGQRQRLR
jgi:hypothetical protein